MKISRITKGLVLLTAFTGMFAIGCELIVDFDRTKILVETPDAADGGSAPPAVVPDGSSPDGGTADASDSGSPADANTADARDQ